MEITVFIKSFIFIFYGLIGLGVFVAILSNSDDVKNFFHFLIVFIGAVMGAIGWPVVLGIAIGNLAETKKS